MINKFFVMIAFVGIITVIFFENNSRKAVNFVLICYILTMILNIIVNLKFNFKDIGFNVDYSKFYEHADEYRSQFNIFFGDIKNKGYSDEKNKQIKE